MAGAAGIALLLADRAHYLRGHGSLPLDRSPYVRDVTEPITIVQGLSLSDGGSLDITFRDARGLTKEVRLDRGFDLTSERNGNVIVDIATPGKQRPVPISGDDERAILGLLERWAVTNPRIGNSGDSVAQAILVELRRRN
jgi:hypothetical protein